MQMQFCLSQSTDQAGTATASSGQLSAPQTSADAAAGKAPGPQASAGVGQKAPALCRISEEKSMTCSLCSREVMHEDYTQHLSDYHVQEKCEQCGAKAWGTVGLSHHIEIVHLSCPADLSDVPAPTTPTVQETTPVPQRHSDPRDVTVPAPAPVPAPPTVQDTSQAPQQPLTLRPPEVNWVSFLPKQFTKVTQFTQAG